MRFGCHALFRLMPVVALQSSFLFLFRLCNILSLQEPSQGVKRVDF